jgi:hypothetical protein
MTANEPKRLVAIFPELAAELQQLLEERGESTLAEQVPGLNLIERCRCGDDFCGMFYVLPKPVGSIRPRASEPSSYATGRHADTRRARR